MRKVSHPTPRESVRNAFGSRPTGALRFVLRLPVYAYGFGLGRVLGYRFLLLVHLGRRSGLLRETVLEVLRHDPAIRESVVLSGWGEEADWYRNILARPALEIRTGGERYVPEQRFLAAEENHDVISEYAGNHPLAFRFLIKAFGFGYPLDGTENERREFAGSLHLVAFRPKEGTKGRDLLGERTNANRQEVVG